jgi:formate hydrogenlyase subunit 3/multisubunit Na+/H+ antiporter MnhD subunit
MTLLPFLIVTIGGTLAAFAVRSRERWAFAIGWGATLGAIVTALAIHPGDVLSLGGSHLVTTDYLRLFLILGSVVGAGLGLVGAAVGQQRDVPAVTTAVLATSAMALALPDPRLAILAASAGGAFGALLAILPVGSRGGASVGIRVVRATAIAATLAISAMAWAGRDLSELAAQPIVFGLAYLAVGLAVAIRFGAIPFHAWAARLTDVVPETGLPLVAAIGPASFAVVALAWTDASIAPLLVDLDSVRAVVLAIAVGSIVLAAVAALIQDEIEHVVAYSIVGDAGVVLLAVAALDPEAWAPARMWILILIVARSAFAAWAAAIRADVGTGQVRAMRGWAVRSPFLAIAFGLVVVASIGWPGMAAFEARADLVALALDPPLSGLVLIATLGPLTYYGRLLAIGLARPPEGAGRRAWLPAFGPLDLTDLRGWASRSWATNRIPTATGGALLMAVLALTVAIGAFGGLAAAAGPPASADQVSDTTSPDDAP